MIAGYRKLSEDEIALINNIKVGLGGTILLHLNDTRLHISRQRAAQAKEVRRGEYEMGPEATPETCFAVVNAAKAEIKRIDGAEPERWIAVANTHFQQGLMALVRAVAQPEGL